MNRINIDNDLQIARELQIKTTHYILAGFSLVVGITWNDTIKHIISKVFPMETDAILMRIIYALFVTLLLIILIRYLPNTSKELPAIVQEKLTIPKFQSKK